MDIVHVLVVLRRALSLALQKPSGNRACLEWLLWCHNYAHVLD